MTTALASTWPIAAGFGGRFAIGAEELNEVDDAAESDPLNDTVEEARARARSKARDFATSTIVSLLLNSSPSDPEKDLADAREGAEASRTLREALARPSPRRPRWHMTTTNEV